MRVAMILGALHRETSHDPGEILFGLNNALIAQGQLGFTTACCIRISLSKRVRSVECRPHRSLSLWA
jgi:hypothetical protein